MTPRAERQNLARRLLFTVGGAAVTLVLLVAAGSLGMAGIFLNLFVAVPAAYVHMRSGTAAGVGAVVLAAVGCLALDGPAGLAGYLLQFGLIAVLLPLLLRRGWPWDRAMFLSAAVIVLATFTLLWGYAMTAGSTLTAIVDTFADDQVRQAMSIYAAADLSPEQMTAMQGAAEKMADLLRYTFPGLTVAVTGALAALLLWLLSVLARGDYTIPGREFARWKAPEMLVWPLIAAGFGYLFFDGAAKRVSVNLLIVLLPVYFLQGLAIVTYFFNRRKISPFLRGLGYMLIAVLNPMPLIITGIGVFDLWIDFRKPRVKGT